MAKTFNEEMYSMLLRSALMFKMEIMQDEINEANIEPTNIQAVAFRNAFNKDVTDALNEMYKKGQIDVLESVNCKLIHINKDYKEKE